MPDALISYPFTEEGLRDALAALGTSGDVVARNLSAMGFKGCRSKSSNCPVANYLLSALPDARSVEVEFGWAWARDASERVKLDVDWPQPVEDFIEMFDAGLLPELEAPDASS
jgi:hypothetical protein